METIWQPRVVRTIELNNRHYELWQLSPVRNSTASYEWRAATEGGVLIVRDAATLNRLWGTHSLLAAGEAVDYYSPW